MALGVFTPRPRYIPTNVAELPLLTQATTEQIAFSRVGWANYDILAISSGIMSICPPYKSYKIRDRTAQPGLS
ncbi:MAG: hypothetical protein F6K50_20850 [Moorea sp. SIO3I7]|uniref:hypothetical protein n=1 Tax=Moorena sp. SIO3I6 TaxID=2607831 RepID=UPI0013CC9166|nr:hypothetical protein [Moorena sp. SIO3I6]NEN97875.1 hypothetical protein [Moorena sp. SIO3I7]NEP26492.1 hypothetical protein [Moorena sp. SIO3I6]